MREVRTCSIDRLAFSPLFSVPLIGLLASYDRAPHIVNGICYPPLVPNYLVDAQTFPESILDEETDPLVREVLDRSRGKIQGGGGQRLGGQTTPEP